nr:DUF4393 domain-containing protein [uncultured Marvinbryantia sp.]
MSEFNFQTVFQILHEPLAGNTSIKKEELYRDIFQGVYQIAGRRCEDDEDTAPFRKFTSGSLPIQKYVAKKLQSIAYCMDDPVLREMYADLLATAMNSETVGNVHPTYVEIIRQMSPYDALVFRELCKQVVIPCMDVVYKNKKTGQSYPISEYVVFTDLETHPLVQTQISLENLKRLCIIDVVKNKKYAAEERYTELKSAIRNTVNEFVEMNKEILKKNEYTVEYQEYVIMIRGFGQFFARACLGTDFSDIM